MRNVSVVYLSQGLLAIIDADDEDRVLEFKWCAVVHKGRFFAAKRYRADERMIYLHRLVMDAPKDVQVRFLNGCSLDCRKPNLRFCSRAELRIDRQHRRGGSSVYRGVHKMHGRPTPWYAQIEHQGAKHFLGTFKTELEAAKAYDSAARRMLGKHAKTNFEKT